MILWKYIKDKLLEHPNQLVCEGNAKMTYEELCVFAENHGKNLKAHYNGILCGSEMATAMALLACFAAENMRCWISCALKTAVWIPLSRS